MVEKILSGFSFHAQWNVGVLFFTLIFAVLYLFLLPTSKQHTRKQTVLFLLGILVFIIAVASPINLLGRIIFRAHMIQLILLLLVVAPLLLQGMKAQFLTRLYNKGNNHAWMNKLTHPVITIPLFHVLFAMYHIPYFFESIRISYYGNYFYIFLLFLSATLLWLPLFPPIRELDRLKRKITYGVVNIILFIPISILLIVSDNLYSIYSDPNLLRSGLELCLPLGDSIPQDLFETILPFPPLREQKLGGFILLISSTTIFGLLSIYNKIKKKHAN